ncbi:MAG: polynucleotide adenylyltransferase PcnB [Zoogloeaceae bacterium]|jgi:poly(A) polymerase|nr:polynucleotide adenylyltransferase PcnB [Zoogloeaceae bacterium]
MIRKFIRKVLRLAPATARPVLREPAVIPRARHGIAREAVSQGSARACALLQDKGYKAYVVGGAVRDLLVGVLPKDFDVATDATPEEVRGIFKRSRIIGRRFRIVHVYMGREIVEITTFRGSEGSAAKTDDHGRLLADNVFGSQAEDAARRDFTVNALYYDPSTECILDYHHGVADLEQKTLRMIGDPGTRYREDPVRMLRAVRLSAKLGLFIDPAARRPIRALAPLLENVPQARLLDEMLKLLTSGHAVKCLEALRAEGLHRGILPLLDSIPDHPPGDRFVFLALSDTDERIRAGKTSSPAFLFAALLWQAMCAAWERCKAAGEAPIPALHLAMTETLSARDDNIAITRRIAADIKEIWMLQPRLEQRAGKRPYGTLTHPRFRAGYDFLCLRARAGEVDAELPDWWRRFQEANSSQRAEMLLPETAPKRKRRKRKTKSHPADPADGDLPRSNPAYPADGDLPRSNPAGNGFPPSSSGE